MICVYGATGLALSLKTLVSGVAGMRGVAAQRDDLVRSSSTTHSTTSPAAFLDYLDAQQATATNAMLSGVAGVVALGLLLALAIAVLRSAGASGDWRRICGWAVASIMLNVAMTPLHASMMLRAWRSTYPAMAGSVLVATPIGPRVIEGMTLLWVVVCQAVQCLVPAAILAWSRRRPAAG
jgi:hypothetical protein